MHLFTSKHVQSSLEYHRHAAKPPTRQHRHLPGSAPHRPSQLTPRASSQRRRPETVRTSDHPAPPTFLPTTIPMASASSSSATSSSTATIPHPRQALRSRNLPPLPEFTFPPSPKPDTDSEPPPRTEIKKQGEKKEEDMAISDLSRKAQWITFALSSGACAAVNGVFAKLFVVSSMCP